MLYPPPPPPPPNLDSSLFVQNNEAPGKKTEHTCIAFCWWRCWMLAQHLFDCLINGSHQNICCGKHIHMCRWTGVLLCHWWSACVDVTLCVLSVSVTWAHEATRSRPDIPTHCGDHVPYCSHHVDFWLYTILTLYQVELVTPILTYHFFCWGYDECMMVFLFLMWSIRCPGDTYDMVLFTFLGIKCCCPV